MSDGDAMSDGEALSLETLATRRRHAATVASRPLDKRYGMIALVALASFVAGAAASALLMRGGAAEESDGWEESATMEEMEEAARDEGAFHWTLLVGVLAVAASIAIGEQLERRHIFRVPEAAIGVLLGVGAASGAKWFGSEDMIRDETFDAEFFMVWLLPPIIFAAGFNMNIPAFSASLVPTLLLAFVGTTLSASAVGGLVYAAGQAGLCYPLSGLAALFFGSLISATDPVTVLAVFQAIGVRDDVFAIVFGESVLNDAVAIVLARTVLAFTAPEAARSGTGAAVFSALLIFVAIFLGSALIGGVAGAASALLYKALRLSDHEGKHVVEAALAFAFPWAAFYASEALGLSGIVAILSCGMVMATYARPNLSAAAVSLTADLFDTLAKVSEAFVFVYLGMALVVFPIFGHHTLWLLVLVALGACLAGRLHVFPLLALATRCHPPRRPLTAAHAFCVWFSGLRGGVAFALAAASYGEANFPALCGGKRAAAGGARRELSLVHCPAGYSDSLAIVQATLLLAVFTIFVMGAGARDVALACGALPPAAGEARAKRAGAIARIDSEGALHSGPEAELESTLGGDDALPKTPPTRWKRLDARLVLLLTRAPKGPACSATRGGAEKSFTDL